jgi:pimeloyl-ACP methyl ester carboxylesterase
MPRLVLLPGLDGTGDLFDPLVKALASGIAVTVVRYTRPPLGSYAQCRAAVREWLPCHEPYVLVGESFSGPVAISIAATQPPGLCGLILVASFVSSPRRMLTWLSPLIRFMPTHGAPGWITDFFLLGRFATPQLRKQVADAMALITPGTARERLREVALTTASSEDLGRVRVPILYMRATHDRLVPRSCGERITRLSARATAVEVNAPHMLLQCAPRECAEAIGEFVKECAAQARGRMDSH